MPNHPLGPAAAAAAIAAGAALVLSLVVAHAPAMSVEAVRLIGPPPVTATPLGVTEAIILIATSVPW